jgi:long-chain acyl-CoA synthetase
VAGMYTMMYYGGSIAFVPIGKNALATLRNVPTAISEVRPHIMLSVPALARNFKKNIESGIKKKGPKVEKLFNFALRNAIKYNKEYYNRGTGGTFWRKPLVDLFDKIIFKQVRESFGGRMQFFVGGGALLDIELQRFFCAVGMPMFQGYGLTEATPIICANSPGHAIFGSSGRIVKPMDIKICDADGKELPHGEKGEIVIRGGNVMAGYWKNPEATAKTVIDGWLYTGDMGYICPWNPEFLYVVGRFKSLLISSDGEKYSPEAFEDSLPEVSKYVSQVVLHNNQSPYTIVLIVPEKEALKEFVQKAGLDPESREGKIAMLDKIQAEIDSYKTGGPHEALFPDRWLPAAVVVCDEPFTIANQMMNSTMKIVRRKVEEHYADRIAYSYTAEGKDLHNEKNIASL